MREAYLFYTSTLFQSPFAVTKIAVFFESSDLTCAGMMFNTTLWKGSSSPSPMGSNDDMNDDSQTIRVGTFQSKVRYSMFRTDMHHRDYIQCIQDNDILVRTITPTLTLQQNITESRESASLTGTPVVCTVSEGLWVLLLSKRNHSSEISTSGESALLLAGLQCFSVGSWCVK